MLRGVVRLEVRQGVCRVLDDLAQLRHRRQRGGIGPGLRLPEARPPRFRASVTAVTRATIHKAVEELSRLQGGRAAGVAGR